MSLASTTRPRAALRTTLILVIAMGACSRSGNGAASDSATYGTSAARSVRVMEYSVTVVRPDPGCSLTEWAQALSPLAPPTVAMADDGDLGFVQRGAATQCGSEGAAIATGRVTTIATDETALAEQSAGLDYSVVVVKADGRRFTIRSTPALKDRKVLSDFFIQDLRFASDGTPFITLADGSTRRSEWALSWNGSTWRSYVFAFPQRYGGPENARIGAASSASHFGVFGDFLDRMRFDYAAQERDPTYYSDEAAIVDGERTISLGFGDITAMRSRFVAGYVAPYGWCMQVGAPTAVRWDGTVRQVLGPGIAFGVDDNGDVVGDDRPPEENTSSENRFADCIDGAHPTLWRSGKTIHLSESTGSALAIRNGTIVGIADVEISGGTFSQGVPVDISSGRAFVARADDADPEIRYLDDLVPKGWKITTAFAIADSGRILAFGRKRGSANADILVLDPVRRAQTSSGR